MGLTAILEICGAFIGGIGGIFYLILNLEDLKKFFQKIKERRRRRFAKKQQPYCSEVCQAPAGLTKVLGKLDKIFEFITITREISIETHGMALIALCKQAIEKEFMSQQEKDDLIHSFIPYIIGDGNGKVFNYVQMGMNLPTESGGRECDVDLSVIVERERERYVARCAKKKEEES